MKLALSSLAGLSSALTEWRPDAVLTVLSPSMRCAPLDGVRHVRFACHDIEMAKLGRLIGPTARQVELARELVRTGPDRLLVQCAMGLSRSPAFAIVALVEAGASPADACARVRTASPHASPNRLVLRMADDALRLDGALMAAVRGGLTFRRKATGALGSPIRWAEAA